MTAFNLIATTDRALLAIYDALGLVDAEAAAAQTTANGKVASVTAADASILIGGTGTAPTIKSPIRNGSVVASTDGTGRIQITYTSHDNLVAAAFPTATNQGPAVCLGDVLGDIVVVVDAASLTASGFKVVLYNQAGSALLSSGPYRVNYVATGH